MVTLTLRVEDQVHQTLQRLADETERSKSYFMKKALEQYLEEYKRLIILVLKISHCKDGYQ